MNLDTLPAPTEADVATAQRLDGTSWHSLTSGDLQRAIVLQRVYGILGINRLEREGPICVYTGRAAEFN